jgi:hypothetical protein
MPKFTLFGDTMNTASRMESNCRPGCIHVSDTFAKLLPKENWESTGGVQVKGKGLMDTFLWVPKPGDEDDDEDEEAEEGTSTARSLQRNASGHSATSTRSRATVREGGGQNKLDASLDVAGEFPSPLSCFPSLAS